jgi:hypothetical protein
MLHEARWHNKSVSVIPLFISGPVGGNSSSIMLISTISSPSCPSCTSPAWMVSIGHFYFAQIGHYHFAATQVFVGFRGVAIQVTRC